MSSVNLADFAYESAVDEFTDYMVYKKMSGLGFERRHRFSGTLKRLSAMEYGHYRFWMKYCPDRVVRVSNLKVYFIIFIRLVLGVTFAVKFLERNEMRTIKKYKAVARRIPQRDQPEFKRIIADEVGHENEFVQQFDEPHIRYISFIVLGLADALVEIAGIHAGSLGIYDRTELAGLAGIIAGAAASIAMASAAYAQAKTGFKGSATLSAIYTGISYFFTALILATPYFLTNVMVYALTASLVFAVVLTAFISFYGSVISGTGFTKDFIEITSIIFGATVALYLIGIVIGYLTGVAKIGL
ncbi:MAG TPA: VIT1/CCC1 family protein [archaeon]|nr:VIT1/CCC1 family protein [archaeon]